MRASRPEFESSETHTYPGTVAHICNPSGRWSLENPQSLKADSLAHAGVNKTDFTSNEVGSGD